MDRSIPQALIIYFAGVIGSVVAIAGITFAIAAAIGLLDTTELLELRGPLL